jgi:L-fuconolactonase
MTIDAHQHFWHYKAETHSWITDDMQRIRRDFLPADLQPVLALAGIEGCIAVQADQSEEETHFLLQLAAENDFIKGVVGWVDLSSPALESRLEYYAQQAKLCGFRHIVQAEPDPNFLLRDKFKTGISLLERYGFTYDILVYPHQLGAALELVRLFPNQAFIIDHIAKPYIKDGYFDGWANQMKAIAQYENVYCKVSGMVTEADWANWQYEDFVPYLDLVFQAFGIQRVVYGSDWPVCLVAAEYLIMKSIVDQYIAAFSETEKELIMGKNAIQFYNIK